MTERALEPLLHNLDETARLLSVSVRKVQYLIADRQLKPVRIGRKPLVPRAEVERYVKRLTLLAEHGS